MIYSCLFGCFLYVHLEYTSVIMNTVLFIVLLHNKTVNISRDILHMNYGREMWQLICESCNYWGESSGNVHIVWITFLCHWLQLSGTNFPQKVCCSILYGLNCVRGTHKDILVNFRYWVGPGSSWNPRARIFYMVNQYHGWRSGDARSRDISSHVGDLA